MNFKNKFTFDQRITESTKVIKKFPDKIPIICEKNIKCRLTPYIDKHKYLVSKDLTLGQFLFVIRNKMNKAGSSVALFLLINGKSYSSSQTISYIYNNEKDQDGYLYILYTGENTFG